MLWGSSRHSLGNILSLLYLPISFIELLHHISTHDCYFCSLRNFGDAEEILTRALTKTEEHFGVSLLCYFVK